MGRRGGAIWPLLLVFLGAERLQNGGQITGSRGGANFLDTSVLSAYYMLPMIGGVQLAAAQVVGVDFGSEFFKAAIVAPGKRMEIILNASSRRKTHNSVSFANAKERSLGDDAAPQALKAPSNVFSNTSMFLGLSADAVAELSEEQRKAMAEETVRVEEAEFAPVVKAGNLQPRGNVWPDGSQVRFSPYQIFGTSRKGVSIEVRKGEYMEPELLAANLLSFIRQMAASTANLKPSSSLGSVLTIPCDMRQRQREALRNAAEISGFKLLHLVHHGAAAALQQALDTPENPAIIRLYVTVGSANAEATVVRFTPVDKNQKPLPVPQPAEGTDGKEKEKEEAASKTAKTDETTFIEVLGCSNVWGVGGRWLGEQLAGSMEDAFMKKNENNLKTDVRNSPRALKKLLAQASLAKVTLSASKQTNFRVENLISQKDFNAPVDRTILDELIVHSGALDGIKKAITSAMDMAGVGFTDIGAFELLGGGWRVPRINAELVEFVKQGKGIVGDDNQILGTHLNADEAAATGAAFVAANSTATFRVKPVFLADGSPYEYTLKFFGLGGGDEEAGTEVGEDVSIKTLIKKMERPGSLRVLKLRAKREFAVEVLEDGEALTTHQILGVTEAIKQREEDRAKELKAAQEAFEKQSKDTAEKLKENVESEKGGLEEAKEGKDAKEESEARAEGEGAASSGQSATSTPGEEAAGKETKNDLQEEVKGEDESASAGAILAGPRVVLSFAIDGAGVIALSKAEVLFEETPASVVVKGLAGGKSKHKAKKVEVRMPLKVVGKPIASPLPLSQEQMKSLKEVLWRLERNDMNVAALREIKNTLEELVYKSRASLSDEFVVKVTEESFREELRKRLEEEEDWVYGDADNAGYDAVDKHIEDLNKLVEPFQVRAKEMSVRESVIERMKTGMNDFQSRLDQIIEKRTWVPRERINDVQKMIKDLNTWWEEKHSEQETRSPILEPLYTEKETFNRVKVVSNALKALNNISKPTTTTTTTTTPKYSASSSSTSNGDDTGSSATGGEISEKSKDASMAETGSSKDEL